MTSPLACDAGVARAPEHLDRLARRQVHQVQRLPGVAGERELAGDAEALAERGPAAEPELGRDGAHVHVAAAGQARLLAVQREPAAGDLVVLERAAHHACGRDRLAVVGEGGCAGVGQLAHLGELRAFEPHRDRAHEADRDLGLVLGARPEAAQDLGRVDDGVGVRHREDRAVAARRGRGGSRGDRLLVLAARGAEMDVRVDERRREHEARAVDDAVAVDVEAGADRGDRAAVDADVDDLVDAFGRIEDAGAADDEVVGAVASDEDAVLVMRSPRRSRPRPGPW